MIEHTSAIELKKFDQGWLTTLEHMPLARLMVALVGLTRFGKHPAALDRAFTVEEMFERPFVGHYRDNLRPLTHPSVHRDE